MRPSTSVAEYEISDQQVLIREIQDLLLVKLAIRVESPDTDLLKTGTLDSVAQVNLLLHLEKRFRVRLPMEDLEIDSFVSVANIAQSVAKRMRAVESPQPARLALIQEIQALFADKLSIRVESAETDLYEAGIFDSMTLVQFILQVEEHFGFHLSMEDFEPDSFRSVAAIAELVARLTPNQR